MSHTWPLAYSYIRCPKCGAIFLDRSLPQKKLGVVQREVLCPSCHNLFSQESKPWDPPDTANWEF